MRTGKGFEIRHVMLLKVLDGAISDPEGFRSNCQASSCWSFAYLAGVLSCSHCVYGEHECQVAH